MELQWINRQQAKINQDAASLTAAVRENVNSNRAYSTMISASLDQFTAAILKFRESLVIGHINLNQKSKSYAAEIVCGRSLWLRLEVGQLKVWCILTGLR